MQSIGRRVAMASVLTLMGVVLACARDGSTAPGEPRENQGAQNPPTSTGQGRSDGVALSITPSALVLRVGDSGTLTAAAVDANGNIVSVPTGTLPWTSSNTAVATVNGNGTVTAIAAGEATVSTTSGGLSGSAKVLVTR